MSRFFMVHCVVGGAGATVVRTSV